MLDDDEALSALCPAGAVVPQALRGDVSKLRQFVVYDKPHPLIAHLLKEEVVTKGPRLHSEAVPLLEKLKYVAVSNAPQLRQIHDSPFSGLP